MLANNEVGIVQPIGDIVKAVKKHRGEKRHPCSGVYSLIVAIEISSSVSPATRKWTADILPHRCGSNHRENSYRRGGPRCGFLDSRWTQVLWTTRRSTVCERSTASGHVRQGKWNWNASLPDVFRRRTGEWFQTRDGEYAHDCGIG